MTRPKIRRGLHEIKEIAISLDKDSRMMQLVSASRHKRMLNEMNFFEALRPFLFEESEADLIINAREIIPKLIEKYKV